MDVAPCQVRGRALSDGVPKEQLTSRQLTSALLEVARDDGSPFIVFLMDKGSAALKSRGVCNRCAGLERGVGGGYDLLWCDRVRCCCGVARALPLVPWYSKR